MKEEPNLESDKQAEVITSQPVHQHLCLCVTVHVLDIADTFVVFLDYPAEASMSWWDTENPELVISCAFQHLLCVAQFIWERCFFQVFI